MSKKVIIVGGVAGGATAAARLRRLDEKLEILMFERGEYISFANCGLPYYIGGIISDRNSLLVQTVDGMAEKFNIDIRNQSEVTEINREDKKVKVINSKTGDEYYETYDYMILSPGAQPIKPRIPGIESARNLFTLRSIPDTDKIKSFIDFSQPKKAIVIGGGFIGVEMAENLAHKGIGVTLVEMADQVLAPLDFEMASIIHAHLIEKGINLVLKDGVKSFEDNGNRIVLQSGMSLDTEMTVLAIGVSPENKLAKDSGLTVGSKGGIIVNEFLQTSDPSIYAIGDAIEVKDYSSGKPVMIPLAGPANKQGRIVANNICGVREKYIGTLGTAVVKIFDMTVAVTGNNEKQLKGLGVDYKAIHIHPGSHAGYYPGALPISIKLLFQPEGGRILGAQAVGYKGVEKRIDVLATAIRGDLKVTDLKDLELTYAPPYSSAKDPVNMLGFAASNIMGGLVESFQWHEVNGISNNDGLILDVREPNERILGYIDNSLNIPLGQLRSNLSKLPKDKTIYIYCQVGIRGYLAARVLTQNGYKTKNLDGGYKTYKNVFGSNSNEICNIQVDDSGVAKVECHTKGEVKENLKLNTCGMQCPGPIMEVFKRVKSMDEGDVLEVSASDPGFTKDIKAWCEKTGNTLLGTHFDGNSFIALIKKGKRDEVKLDKGVGYKVSENKENATIVVFSGDLDKTLASFIIASGAAAMGKKVTLFFTFWGLNALRRDKAPYVKKDILERMFGWMMPRGAKKLPISKMNMAGAGSTMIKYVMKQKNVDSLEVLMEKAMEAGVKLVACSMSMDIMGIKKEELIDGIEIGGVAAYLGEAEEANLNLFI